MREFAGRQAERKDNQRAPEPGEVVHEINQRSCEVIVELVSEVGREARRFSKKS